MLSSLRAYLRMYGFLLHYRPCFATSGSLSEDDQLRQMCITRYHSMWTLPRGQKRSRARITASAIVRATERVSQTSAAWERAPLHSEDTV